MPIRGLSAFYEQEVRKWLFNHLVRAVTIYQIDYIIRAAYLRAAIPQTAVKGFENSGIYPFNNDAFPDHLFSLSDTIEKPIEIGDNPLPEHSEVESPITTILCLNNLKLNQQSPTILCLNKLKLKCVQ